MGAALAKAFSSDANIEAHMLRFIERCPSRISRPVIETIAGLLPIGTLAMMIIEDHYRDGTFPNDKGLMVAMGALKHYEGGRLVIAKGPTHSSISGTRSCTPTWHLTAPRCMSNFTGQVRSGHLTPIIHNDKKGARAICEKAKSASNKQ